MGRLILLATQVCLLVALTNCDTIVQPNRSTRFLKNPSPTTDDRFTDRQSDNGEKSWDIRNLDMSRFIADPRGHIKWIGYFYEESIIPALQNTNSLMIDCVVIEVRQEKDQRAALFDLGKYMQLVPLEFDDMVTLTGLCGQLKSPAFQQNQIEIKSDSANQRFPLFGSVILPGTLWCGLRDVAPNYKDLGEKFELDSCCRDHDHCPVKLSSFESRYGITNFGVATRSHCRCDRILYNCLKKSRDKSAESVGNVYFNLLRINCATEDSKQTNTPTVYMLYKCTQKDETNGCRMWVKRKNYQKKLKLIKFPEKF